MTCGAIYSNLSVRIFSMLNILFATSLNVLLCPHFCCYDNCFALQNLQNMVDQLYSFSPTEIQMLQDVREMLSGQSFANISLVTKS